MSTGCNFCSLQSFKNKFSGSQVSWLIIGSCQFNYIYKCLIFVLQLRHILQVCWSPMEPSWPVTIGLKQPQKLFFHIQAYSDPNQNKCKDISDEALRIINFQMKWNITWLHYISYDDHKGRGWGNSNSQFGDIIQ